MTAPSEHRILADTGAVAVAEEGARVIVFDRQTGTLTILALILGVAAVAVGTLGVGAMITATDLLPGWAAGLLLAVGVALAVAVVLLAREIRRRRQRPLHDCRSLAVLDCKRGLFSAAGGGLIQLDQVRFARKWRITNFGPRLVALTPQGTKLLKRGSFFDGGLGKVDEVLNAVAHRRAPARDS